MAEFAPWKVGVHGIVGLRRTMEDEHTIHITPHAAIFAVYDGHGGKKAAVFLKDTLHKELEQFFIPENGDRDDFYFEQKIKESFSVVDEKFKEELIKLMQQSNPEPDEAMVDNDGSTAAVCVIYNNKLYVANVGDTEVFLLSTNSSVDKPWKVECLTEIHHPSIESEKDRIRQAGGRVVRDRVNDSLAVSRAFGDFYLKRFDERCTPKEYEYTHGDCVSIEPFVKIVPWDRDEHLALVIGCDGVWEALHNPKIYRRPLSKDQWFHKLHYSLCVRNKEIQKVTEKLVYESLKAGSSDNITALIVDLRNM